MKEKIEKLNLLVADMNVLFVKLHNYHWNVKGIEFYSIHAMTEKMYDQVAEIYDTLAERILQLGSKPINTVAQALKISRIKEEEKSDFSGRDVLMGVQKDLEFLVKEFKYLSKLSEGDKTTEAYADGIVADFEKQLWMIRSSF